MFLDDAEEKNEIIFVFGGEDLIGD